MKTKRIKDYEGNMVAYTLKFIAVVCIIISAISAYSEEKIITIVVGAIVGTFTYSIGEIIEILDASRENSEHFRIYIEELKKNEKELLNKK